MHVIINPDESLKVMQDEIFGPILIVKIDFISMTPSGAISTLKGFHQVFMALLGILKKCIFLQQNLQAISLPLLPGL